jgi:hypothetical protein
MMRRWFARILPKSHPADGWLRRLADAWARARRWWSLNRGT